MTAVPAGRPELPHLPGVVTAAELADTVTTIVSAQHPDGLVPWFAGHHADPWDHVEAAMALAVGGEDDAARLALRWSAEHQAGDGSWPLEIRGPGTPPGGADSNQAAYLAVGVWHHWLVTGDDALARELWPAVRAALQFTLGLQRPDGALAWARGADGGAADEALLTGSACSVLALRCGAALADLVGDPHPAWTRAAARLAHAVAAHPDAFADRSRFSMDWYYPVLGGAVRGGAGRALVSARWDEFVVAGRGIRCVADRPWVTAAETCELVLALDTLGDVARAEALLRDVQFLRDTDGSYWTGWVFPEQVVWPQERTTWTAAAVVLAADALAGATGGSGVFRGHGLAPLVVPECGARCTAVRT